MISTLFQEISDFDIFEDDYALGNQNTKRKKNISRWVGEARISMVRLQSTKSKKTRKNNVFWPFRPRIPPFSAKKGGYSRAKRSKKRSSCQRENKKCVFFAFFGCCCHRENELERQKQQFLVIFSSSWHAKNKKRNIFACFCVSLPASN